MSKRKLLLADDSVTIQKVVNLTFADEGIEVIAVGDGDSAMEKFVELSPDLVMADVNMPGLNGYQVCEQIRQSATNRHIPVILLVGSFEPFDEAEAARVGADDHLTKPFQSIRQLVNKVTVLLNSTENSNSDSIEIQPEVSSFEDTLEMEAPETVATAPVQFTDYGDDDEMIQANPVSSFSLDESQKFETKIETVEEADFSTTQPLTTREIKDFDFIDSTSEQSDQSATETVRTITQEDFETEVDEETETIAEEVETVTEELTVEETVAETENFVEETTVAETPNTESEDEMPLPEAASVLQLDEMNPLELPPIESDGEVQGDVFETDEATPLVTLPATEKTTSATEITPELIDEIVQKVMERLSDKAVKEIAWEVVPEVAERIVKKMAEENLKK